MTLPILDPAILPATTGSTSLADAIRVAIDSDAAMHADYDLHPLCVRSLEHYVEREDGERFHVR